MQTKIRIRAGVLEIEYEGPDTYLFKQLPELIAQLQEILPRTDMPELIRTENAAGNRGPGGTEASAPGADGNGALAHGGNGHGANGNGDGRNGGNGHGGNGHPIRPPIPEDLLGDNAPKLEDLIAALGPAPSQWKRFLATTVWLHTLGLTRVQTNQVTKALYKRDSRRIGNPSACLAKNLDKGYLTRDGVTFFVTQDGIAALEGEFTR
ncbi:MAG: hypothetical protein HKN20_02050 [Gemmatimonadetes bacterium]|nr:hypothetical protein [Gemmatimonadota bacterium]